MTDDTTATPSGEEPTPSDSSDTQMPEIPEIPAVLEKEGETTQAMPGEIAPDEMDTLTVAPAVADEVTQVTPGTIVAEAELLNPAEPQAAPQPAPAQDFEQFGAQTDSIAATPYPASTPVTPQSGAPAFYAQSAYAPQPGQPLALAPATRKRRPLLLIAIVAIVAFLLGSGSVFAYTSVQSQLSSPNSTLQTYCHGVKTANAQEVYDTLSQQARVHTSLDDIRRTFSAFDLLSSLGTDTSMKFGNCTVSNIHVSGSLAVATITMRLDMTFQGQTTSIDSPSLVSLVLENNQWKIDFSSLAQPAPNISGSLFPGGMPTPPPDFLTPTVGQ